MSAYVVGSLSNTSLQNGAAFYNRLYNIDGLGQLTGGDVVVLVAGAQYTAPSGTPFVIPDLGNTTPITIRSSSLANLPAGIRVSPFQGQGSGLSNYMPVILSPAAHNDPQGNTGKAVLSFASSSAYWTFKGIEFRVGTFSGSTLNQYELFNLIAIGNGGVADVNYNTGQTTTCQMPSDITFDRCLVWSGFPGSDNSVNGQEIREGISMHGAYITIENCYIYDIKSRHADCQAMNSYNGQGPWIIRNNYIEGSTENLIFGGTVPGINLLEFNPGSVIENNWFRKPLYWKPRDPQWDGSIWEVKNILEFKNANNINFQGLQGQSIPSYDTNFYVHGNALENSWASADQKGHAVLFTPRASFNQGTVVTQVSNIQIIGNHILNTFHFTEIISTDTESDGIVSGFGDPVSSIEIVDNVIEGLWNQDQFGADVLLWNLDLSQYVGGTFTLSYNDPNQFSSQGGIVGTFTTGNISWSSNIATLASNIQTALNSLSSMGVGSSVCSGSGTVVTIDLSLATTYGNLTVNTTNLLGFGPVVLNLRAPSDGQLYVGSTTNAFYGDTVTRTVSPGNNNTFNFSIQNTSTHDTNGGFHNGDIVVLDGPRNNGYGNAYGYNPGWERVVIRSVSQTPSGNYFVGTFECDTVKPHQCGNNNVVGTGFMPIFQYNFESRPWAIYMDCGLFATNYSLPADTGTGCPPRWGSGTTYFNQTGYVTPYGQSTPVNTLSDINIHHNTFVTSHGGGVALVVGGSNLFNNQYSSSPQSKHHQISLNDNIIRCGGYALEQAGDINVRTGYGFSGQGGGPSNALAQEMDDTLQIRNNIIYFTSDSQSVLGFTPTNGFLAAPSGFSYVGDPNLYYTDNTGVMFTNWNSGYGGTYTLQTSSPGKAAATDGSDIGARIFNWYTDGNGPPLIPWKRINICGFETGNSVEVLSAVGTSVQGGPLTNASIQNSVVEPSGGIYALQVNPTGANVGGAVLVSPDSRGFGLTPYNYPTVWHRICFNVGTLPASANEEICFFYDTSGGHKGSIRINSCGVLEAYDSTDTNKMAIGTTVLALNTWYRIEAMWGTGANGSWSIYINGNLEIQGIGNLGNVNNGYFGLGKLHNRNSKSVNFYYDQVAMDSVQFPGAGAVVAIAPNRNGSVQQWIENDGPNYYQQVNSVVPFTGVVYSAPNYVEDNVAGDTFLVGFNNNSSAGISNNSTIYAVKFCAMAADDSGSGLCSANLQFVSGVETFNTAMFAAGSLSSNFTLLCLVENTDPNTLAGWNSTSLNSIQAGMVNDVGHTVRIDYESLMVEFSPALALTVPDIVFNKNTTNQVILTGPGRAVL